MLAAGNVSGRTPSGNWILLKFGVDCVTSLVNFGSKRGGIRHVCAELLSPSPPPKFLSYCTHANATILALNVLARS